MKIGCRRRFSSLQRKFRKVRSRSLAGGFISVQEAPHLLASAPIQVREGRVRVSTSSEGVPNEIYLEVPTRRVFFFKDVYVFPEFSIAHDRFERVIEDTAFSIGRLTALSRQGQLRNFPVRKISSPFLVMESGWSNYYHWLIDDLSRLAWLRLLDLDRFPLVILCLTQRLSRDQERILKAALPSNFEIRFFPPGSRVTGPLYIHLPSCAESEAAIIPADARLQLSEWSSDGNMEHRPSLTQSPFVYVSRSHAPKRRFSNEVDLLKVLNRYGFERFHLEDLTIGDQVLLFGQARLVIAQHGAGLSNLVFAERLEGLFEVHSHQAHHHYRWLVDEIGAAYASVVVDAEDYNDDVEAPLAEIETWIQESLRDLK
jgi:capsular polysaccharide biosynthesis protein